MRGYLPSTAVITHSISHRHWLSSSILSTAVMMTFLAEMDDPEMDDPFIAEKSTQEICFSNGEVVAFLLVLFLGAA